MDWRKPKVKLFAGVAVLVLVTALGGAILPPLSGPTQDAGSRIEAGGSSEPDDRFAADEAGSLEDDADGPLQGLAATLTVDDGTAESADIAAGAADGTDGDGLTDGTTTDGTAGETADGETTATTAAGEAGSESNGGEAGDGDETTTTTAAPATTTTTAAPVTTAPAPPNPPAGGSGAPGTNLRTLYVDGSRGSGHNPGTEDRPFRRPIEATSIAEPGTTIYLRGGTYDTNNLGALSIRRSGTAQNWIRIAPYPGERVELVAGGEFGSGFEFLGASYVELSGFVIRGRNDSIHGTGVFVKDGAHDIRVIGNQISNFGGGGISVIGASRVTIEGNDVRDNAFRSHYQGSGISIYKPTGPVASGDNYTNVIRGNYVAHNYNAVPHAGDGRITDGNCIIMDRTDEVGYQGRTLIENNICVENGGRGVHTYRSSNIVARNNTMYHNMWSSEVTAGRGEMTAGEGRNIVFYNNLVFNRPGVASYINNNNQNTYFHNNHVASGPPPGEGNVVLPHGASHYFRSTNYTGSPDQFRPVSGSGLAGSANSDRQSSNDFAGRTRPRPGTVGAYEQ